VQVVSDEVHCVPDDGILPEESKSDVIVWSKLAIGSELDVVVADATVSMRSVENTIAQTALKRNDGLP
jgi:hypothetical protein